jgi:hypothetical protein
MGQHIVHISMSHSSHHGMILVTGSRALVLATVAVYVFLHAFESRQVLSVPPQARHHPILRSQADSRGCLTPGSNTLQPLYCLNLVNFKCWHKSSDKPGKAPIKQGANRSWHLRQPSRTIPAWQCHPQHCLVHVARGRRVIKTTKERNNRTKPF